MTFIKSKLTTAVTVVGIACISVGCSTIDPENQAAQNPTSTENVVEMECGDHILEIKIDDLTREQKEELKELKTRCRIDTVARKLEVKPGFIGSGVYSDPANSDRVGPDVGR